MQAMPPLYNNKKPHIQYATNGYLSHSTQIPTQYNSLPNAPQLEYYTSTNIYTQIPQLNDIIPGYNSMVPLTTASYYNNSTNSTFQSFKPPKIRRRAFSKRSKTGCFTCRERRIKCDECKPICKNCIKSKRICKFPVPEEVKSKITKFKSNTNLKNNKREFDNANIDNSAFQESSSTVPKEQSTDVLPSNQESFSNSTIKSHDPIIWKENTFKTICKVDTQDGSKVRSTINPFHNPSAEPAAISQSTEFLYQNNQQQKQRSERSQSLHIQRQQQQQQQDHNTYANINQYHPLYVHSYNLPPTQLPHDYSFPPQLQNSTIHSLGYQTYKDSTLNTNYGVVNVVPTQGNHISMKATADHWGSNRYTHSNAEAMNSGNEKEYFYAPYGKRNQSDNLNQSQQLSTYQQIQINQLQQCQPNTPNSNNPMLYNKQSNEFNQLPNKEQ